MLEEMPGMNQERVDRLHEFFASSAPKFVKRACLGLLQDVHLMDMYKDTLITMPRFGDLMKRMTKELRDMDAGTLATVEHMEKWAAANPQKYETLKDLIAESSTRGVDPSLPREEYKTDLGVSQTDYEGVDRTRTWDDMQRTWKLLGEDGRNIYLQNTRFYKQQYEYLLKALSDKIDYALPGGQHAAAREELKKIAIRKLVENGNLIKGYSPLYREGPHWLSFLDNGIRTRKSFETERARERFITEILHKDPNVPKNSIERTAQSNATKPNPSLSIPAMKTVMDTLKDVDKAHLESIFQHFVDSMPDSHFMKSFAHRENVPGFERDFIKVMRNRGTAMNRKIVNIKYRSEIERYKHDLGEEVKMKGNTEELNELAKEMIDRADAVLNPHSSPLARGLTTAAYIKTLGGNISTGVMDMAHVPFVAFPHLGGIYGYREANAAIARATKTIIQMSPIKRIQLASSIKPGSTDFINHKAFRSIDHIDFNDPKQQHLKYLMNYLQKYLY